MIVDMHVHTWRGGYDSSLRVESLLEEARAKGVGGVCLTEHMHFWSQKELDSLDPHPGVVLIGAIEVETDMGHMLAYGLKHYVSGIHRASELRRVVDDLGGFLVVAHPFRMFFQLEDFSVRPRRPWTQAVADAVELPALQVVHAMEVLNGGCTERENALALEVAGILGMPGVGGSDAHSEGSVGCFATLFERDVSSEADLIGELKAGRFQPAKRLPSGEYVSNWDEVGPGQP